MQGTVITLGPFVLPVLALALVSSYFSMSGVVYLVAPRLDFDPQWARRVIEMSILAGVIAARLGFVFFNWESYIRTPWSVLYFWQPGYSMQTGVIVGVTFAAWRIQQMRILWHKQSITILVTGLLTGAMALYLIIGLALVVNGRDTVKSGATISEFALEDLDGNTVHWSDFSGEGTILNFWATWCPPCRREMPLLNQVHQFYKSRGLNVIGISVGEDSETVRNYIDTIGVTYPIWVDGNRNTGYQTQEIFDRYGGAGLPTTVFVDRDSVIQKVYVGELSRGYIDSEVQNLITETN